MARFGAPGVGRQRPRTWRSGALWPPRERAGWQDGGCLARPQSQLLEPGLAPSPLQSAIFVFLVFPGLMLVKSYVLYYLVQPHC